MKASSSWRTAAVSCIFTALACVACAWLAYRADYLTLGSNYSSTQNGVAPNSPPRVDDEKFNIVCEVQVMTPGKVGGEPPKIHTETIVGGLDFQQKTGWYQGSFSITENRKGTLSVKDGKAEVSRPAMFERFGEKVASEQFTIDRATGVFEQRLILQDGRRLEVVKGHCGRLTPPPF